MQLPLQSQLHYFKEDTMKFYDRTVSGEFREELAKILPALADNQAYWRMTQHLLFGTLKDTDTDCLALPSVLIAAIEEKKYDSHYVAHHFLNAYRRDVMDFKIAAHVFSDNSGEGRCRTVEEFMPPAAVQGLADGERMHYQAKDRVWMSTGNVYLRKHASAQRKADRDEAQEYAKQDSVCAETKLLLNYLNALPPHRFTIALKHLPEAREAASRLKDADSQLNLLKAIGDYAQPMYKPADKTTRVFTLRESVLRLHRDLRKIMTRDWVTADLRSAQLAIVAQVWGIPTLTDYLQSRRSIWSDLCQHMGMEFTADNKANMKAVLYSLIFGAGRKSLTAKLGRSFPCGREAYERFKSDRVIRSLILARHREKQKIRRDQGAFDAFGNFTELEVTSSERYEYDRDNCLSILACVAQSYELMLLLPVIRLAVAEQSGHHGFAVTTWLHDGFTFTANDPRDMTTWKDRITAAVKAEAERLGIITELEFE